MGRTLWTRSSQRDAHKDLFSPQDGLLLPTAINKQFDNGLLTIVPKLKDVRSKAEVTLEPKSELKEFKLIIMGHDRGDILYTMALDFPEQITCRELNGMMSISGIDFRNCHSPYALGTHLYL
jgi:hypothetical protein